jgi:hypothetical protein
MKTTLIGGPHDGEEVEVAEGQTTLSRFRQLPEKQKEYAAVIGGEQVEIVECGVVRSMYALKEDGLWHHGAKTK